MSCSSGWFSPTCILPPFLQNYVLAPSSMIDPQPMPIFISLIFIFNKLKLNLLYTCTLVHISSLLKTLTSETPPPPRAQPPSFPIHTYWAPFHYHSSSELNRFPLKVFPYLIPYLPGACGYPLPFRDLHALHHTTCNSQIARITRRQVGAGNAPLVQKSSNSH